MFLRTLRFALPASIIGALTLCACGGGSMPSPGAASSVLSPAHKVQPPGRAFSWLQPGIDSTHVGDNTAEKKLKVRNVARLISSWQFPTNAGMFWPVLTDGSVGYANSGDGNLYAINLKHGTKRWSFSTGAYGESALTPAAMAGTLVYAGCNVGGSSNQQGFCAVDRTTGQLSWSWYENCNCRPSAFDLAGPVVNGSTLVFGYYTGGAYGHDIVVALDATTGAFLWDAPAGSGSVNSIASATPAIDGGNIFIGTDHGLCSLQLSDGALNWCSGPDDNGTAPAVANGVVYVTTIGYGVYAYDESTGTQLWQYSPSSGYTSNYDPPVIAQGTVYFATYDSGPIYALKASDGTLLFTAGAGSFNTETLDPPSVANGVLYAPCNAGLCAYNASTGGLLLTTSGIGKASPTIDNGVVYIGCGASRSAGVNNVCAYHL